MRGSASGERQSAVGHPRANLVVDALTWIPALLAAAWLRLDVAIWSIVAPSTLVVVIAVAAVLQLAVSLGIARVWGMQVTGSVDDVLHVVAATSIVGATLFVTGLTPIVAIPRSIPLIALLVAVPLSVGVRILWRLVRERRARPDPASASGVLVFGAGWGGTADRPVDAR